ncbi:MAG: GAF domain-containing protein [Chloroflexi bacterium]|nr:GAF domain-containing protein [Chloroflexota bacterium]
MEHLHPLLTHQLQQHLGSADAGALPQPWLGLIQAVNDAYHQADHRAIQLQTGADVAGATSVLNLKELLPLVTQLISERFGFYHVGIFLVDDARQFAVLQAANSEGGRAMLARGHKLKVGAEGIVGYVTGAGQARIALNVGRDAAFFNNPDLPLTRSEIAVPLKLREQVIGALDVQSVVEAAFAEEDVSLLATLADQIAVAIENARSYERAQTAIDELNVLTARLTRQAWQEFTAAQPIALKAESGLPARASSGQAMQEALRQQQTVQTATGQSSELAVPITLRGQVIGALSMEELSPGHEWSEDDRVVAREIADHVALALDNARLLDEVSQERENLGFLFESSRALASTLSLPATMQTALEFAPRLGAQHGYLLLLGDHPEEEATFRGTVPGLDSFTASEAHQFALTIARQGLEQWVLEHGQTAVVSDTRHDPRWFTVPTHEQEEPARAVVSVPLRTQRGIVTGVLAYTHPLPNSFSPAMVPLIESVGSQVAVALENARLYQRVSRQQFNASVLARATQALARSLDQTRLMEILAEELYAAYQPNGVAVYQWDPIADTLTPVASKVDPGETDPWPEANEPMGAAERPDLGGVIIGRRPEVRRVRLESAGRVRQALLLPFVYNEQAEGVVEIVHTGPQPGMTQDDVELAQAILTSASYALQTARLYEQLLETADRLRDVDLLKSQFLANMSHELRTPLNSIIGFSRVIIKGIDGPVTDVQVQDLTAIHSAGQHLLGLINDILDLSRIEAGKMELAFDQVDLAEIVKGVLSTTLGLTKDKPVRLISELPPDLPRVYADNIRVRQVLLNLLSNAAKFTDEGAIAVRAAATQQPGSPPMVHVQVHDTGMGIAEADQAKLFQSFSQVDGSATRKTGGSGLGLAISKTLVELHGGSIWVESATGSGTTFHFTLPVYEPAPASNAPGGEHRKILAVEDDTRLIDLYRRYLESRGYVVHGVTDSTDALSAARNLRPYAILLDVMMRDRDGWQVLRELKQTSDTRNIPVIICSNLDERDKGMSLGASGYLVKPILDTDLLTLLDRLSGQRSATREAALPKDDLPSEVNDALK